jgi:hypothetical protein
MMKFEFSPVVRFDSVLQPCCRGSPLEWSRPSVSKEEMALSTSSPNIMTLASPSSSDTFSYKLSSMSWPAGRTGLNCHKPQENQLRII